MTIKALRVTSFEISLSNFLGKVPDTSLEVLDVGGGSGHFWRNILQDHERISLTIADPFDVTGLDDLSHNRIRGTWREVLPGIPDNSFNVVTAIDVIEHIESHEAYLLMYEMQRISRGCIVVYTPNGFLWQPPSPNNPHNAHVSGWSVKDLRQFGFEQVLGHVGWKKLFGPYALRKDKYFRGFLKIPLQVISFFVAIFIPSQAFAISGWQMKHETIPYVQDR